MRRHTALLHTLLVGLHLSFSCPSSEAQSLVTLSSPPILVPDCSPGLQWDPQQLACTSCLTNQIVGPSGKCICALGFYRTNATGILPEKLCVECPTGEYASVDERFCHSCAQAGNPSASGNQCSCNANQYLAERDNTGAQLAAAVCTDCPSNTYPTLDLSACIPCSDTVMTASYSAATNSYQCVCRTDLGYDPAPQDGKCVSSASVEVVQSRLLVNPYLVSFKDVVAPGGTTTSLTVRSDAFAFLYMGATTGCEFAWNSSSCEALSNLCALQLYDTSASACQYYLRIAQQRAQLSSDTSASLPLLPSLYYTTGASDAGFITSQVIDLPLAVSAEKRVSSLPLVLATYSLNGTFIGLQEVATQLQKCASDPIDQLGVWRNIGHDYDTSCSVNLASLVSKYPSTVFYDMYIKDQSDKLIPVPIRLINYRSGGRQPNLNPDPWNFASNTFFRRFFVVDSVSGVENSVLRAVRIASKIHFWVRKESTGRIYVPIVDLTYTERDATLLSASDSSYQSSPTVEFGIQYITELDSFWKAVTVLFALICVIGGFLALFRARAWSSRNLGPADGWDFQYLVRCILILAEVLAPLLFWLLLTLSMYWFFAFKSQSELNVLLPYSDRDMTRLNAAHATSLACYALHVVTKLYQQCTADIFLIDWEQSKGRIIQSGADERPKLAPISVWRSVFLANEWDELQTYRQVNIEFMLLAMYFIFEGLQVRYAATPQPDMNNLTPGAVHRILLFALEGMVWIGLAAVQILFRKIVYDRYYKNKLFNFVDVLSMANLSILAFDEMCHGYYIHGRSIHPCADTNIGELNAYLRREKADLVPRRGLDDTDEQCFEMFAQKEMRSAFNKVYGIVIAEVETQMAGNLAARLQRLSPEKQLRRFGGVDEARVRAYETVNHFLKSFFDRNLKEFQYMVRERTHVERLLAKTPDVSHSTALFHDPACFTNLLLHGIEYHLLLFYVLVFSLASYTLDSTGAAALITCLVDVLVRVGRRHFGGKNVAKKMMMDPKFLI